MTFELTAEQRAIAEAVTTGRHLVVQAGAGTGKTSTIEVLADIAADHNISCLYLAFNKSIAGAVGKRFSRGNVMARTFHSVAFQIARGNSFIAPLMDKLGSDNALRPFDVAKYLGVESVHKIMTWEAKNRADTGREYSPTTLYPHQVVGYAQASLTRWCQSADEEIGPDHVVYPRNMAKATAADAPEPDPSCLTREQYCEVVLGIARDIWNDIIDPVGRVRFTHDHYLKLVSLARPNFVETLGLPPGSIIFFDEAQDARPCMTSIVHDQAVPPVETVMYAGQRWSPRMQIVTVGDSCQAIYGSFTGARDALPEFEKLPDSQTLPLTTSWRFGQVIAETANDVLELLDAPIRLSGNPNISSTVDTYTAASLNVEGAPDAVLVRTNNQLIEEVLHYQGRGYTTHAEDDTRYIMNIVADVERLADGQRPRNSDMRIFDSFADIEEYIDSEFSDPALAMLLSIILKHGTDVIRQAFDSTVTEDKADVTVSTIHKSKGRQWDTVVVAMDAYRDVPRVVPEPGQLGEREKLMLIYVAFTRAKKRLFIPHDVADALDALGRNGLWLPESEDAEFTGKNSRGE